jgi:hypothetical protein
MAVLELHAGKMALQVCPECGRKPKRVIAGKCGACYERARHGAGLRKWPLLPPEIAEVLHPVPATSRTFARRVFSRIDVSGDCWQWTGATREGYGCISRGVRGAGDIPAHRAVWELLVGPIADDMEYDHRCKNHGCVNPDHGEIVTPQENLRRSYSVSALYSKRKKCDKGHPLDGIRRHGDSPGERYCKTCNRDRERRRREAARAARIAVAELAA